jgi:hypothetical protein
LSLASKTSLTLLLYLLALIDRRYHLRFVLSVSESNETIIKFFLNNFTERMALIFFFISLSYKAFSPQTHSKHGSNPNKNGLHQQITGAILCLVIVDITHYWINSL